MRTFVTALVFVLCIVLATSLNAQSQHAASSAAIDQALVEHLDQRDSDRRLVERLLERPDVKAIAAEAGLDVRRAQSAIATLDAGELAHIAAHARTAEDALAGGQSRVTISTTLIIIALLILILLIVALK